MEEGEVEDPVCEEEREERGAGYLVCTCEWTEWGDCTWIENDETIRLQQKMLTRNPPWKRTIKGWLLVPGCKFLGIRMSTPMGCSLTTL